MKHIAIFGPPRSGTSWLGQIFNSHPDVALRFQPLFSYGHKGRVGPASTRQEIDHFFDELVASKDAFALMKAEMHKSYPAFKKSLVPTHVAFKEVRYLHVVENMLQQCPDIKVIGIVRNPLATLASWISAPKEFSPEWDVHREWRTAPSKNQGRPEEFFGFDKWKEAASNFLRFQERFPDQFALVRYDHLNADPVTAVTRLFAFCGLAMHPQVTQFIVDSQTRHDADPYSVFRARASDDAWHKILPSDVVDDIRRELKGSPLEAFLGDATHA